MVTLHHSNRINLNECGNVVSGSWKVNNTRAQEKGSPQPTLNPLPAGGAASAPEPPGPLVGEENFRALQETIRVILKKAELERMSLHGLKSVFPPDIPYVPHNGSFL